MTDSLMVVMSVLAENGPQQTGPDFGKASPFGLIVVVLLLIGTFALVWSMNRHLKRLPKSFDGQEPDGDVSDLTAEKPSDGTEREQG
jgi:hypothetical protein